MIPYPHDLSTPTPADHDAALDALRKRASDDELMLLHSGRLNGRWANRSIWGTPKQGATFDALCGGRWNHCNADDPAPALSADPFVALEETLRAYPGEVFAGYLSYDLARYIEELPTFAANDRTDWPLWRFHRLDNLQQCQPPVNHSPLPPLHTFSAETPTPVWDESSHRKAVARGVSFIAHGDVFQVNLAQRFSTLLDGLPRDVFLSLTDTSPAWHGALLEMPSIDNGPDLAFLSTSPELFLQLDADGTVWTRPIKGTRPSSCPPEALRDSAKDAAELHMIVDLMRNDLGRVCDYGSIEVVAPREIESHPTVHHGVSTVRGTLRSNCGLADLLRATFPPGSVTGAPKKRAMEIIDEVEPVRRGPYCGAFGWLRALPDGGFDGVLSVTIRTLLCQRNTGDNRWTTDFSVGGGIVSDSDPKLEYEETLHKAAAMQTALRSDTAQ